jgi:hypothetical protein
MVVTVDNKEEASTFDIGAFFFSGGGDVLLV